MIKEFEGVINEKVVKLKCDDSIGTFIESFILLLDREDKKYGIIKDNYTINIGWSFYFIKKEGNVYKIITSDYSKNPFIDKSEDLTFALSIQMAQNKLLHDIKQEGCNVTFQDKIVALKDALNSSEVYMHRSCEPEKNSSGWYLGLINDPKDKHPVSDYVSIYTFELLKYNPTLIQVLCIDVGDLAIIHGNNIIEIVNKNNEKIY